MNRMLFASRHKGASMKNICAVISILVLGIACAPFLQAQQVKPYEFAELDGVWGRIRTSDQTFSNLKLTAAEQKIAVQKRETIFEILKNSKVLTPFKGIALRADKQA